jgi:hypothetical protein
MPAVWFMGGMTPPGRFHPMANSSTFDGKRLRRLSKIISAWNTGPSDQQSRNLLTGKFFFSRRLIPPHPPDLRRDDPTASPAARGLAAGGLGGMHWSRQRVGWLLVIAFSIGKATLVNSHDMHHVIE